MNSRLSRLMRQKLVVGLLGLVLLGVFTAILVVPNHLPGPEARVNKPRATSTPLSSTPPATPAPATLPALAPGEAQQPQRLVIPKLAIDAAVEKVGIDGQGSIGIPSDPNDVAWYRLGPLPGAPGNAIIDGHLDWTSGPAVFSRLQELRVGDQVVIVRGDRTRVDFLVIRRRVFQANQRPPADMWGTGGPARVSLITCSGSWDKGRQQYRERLVVDAQTA